MLQPVDPLRLWKTPPFECRLEDGAFKGRGVDDDKGKVMQLPKAVRVFLQDCPPCTAEHLPVLAATQ